MNTSFTPARSAEDFTRCGLTKQKALSVLHKRPAKELDLHAAGFRELRVKRVDLRDTFNVNFIGAHVFAERETGEDAALSCRVDTLDVRRRVRLGIAQTLGVCKRVRIALAVL